MFDIDFDASRAVVVIGAGGHAKVAIEALRFSGWQVVGCIDSDITPRPIVGTSVLGPDELLPELFAAGVRFAFVALGDNRMRQARSETLIDLGFELPAAIGPNAAISPSAAIGAGVAILSGAVVNADASIGDFAIINTCASIDHDCVIGKGAHVAPGCVLAGSVTVGDRAYLGAGSTIIPRVTIGQDSIIGAGSVVVRNIPAQVTAMGVPARIRVSAA